MRGVEARPAGGGEQAGADGVAGRQRGVPLPEHPDRAPAAAGVVGQALPGLRLGARGRDRPAFDEAGTIVGCGGVRVHVDGQTAFLRWGMIQAALHRRGYGRRLTLARLRRLSAQPQVVCVILTPPDKYRTLGFHDVATLPDHYGPGLDRHTMEATIDAAAAFRQRLDAW